MEIGVIGEKQGMTLPWQASYSAEAEQAVLGSILIDARCVKDVLKCLEEDDFYIRTNQDIFRVIRRMHTEAKPIDGVTVAAEMEMAGVYNETTRSYQIGRASVGKECVRRCRSRWSPYH